MQYKSDDYFMQQAIQLALASEREGNLPIGALITLDGEVVGEGHSAVLEPEYDPGRHAEIVAIRNVDTSLWPRAAEMTCYTTLEPCVMCAGTLLLHGVGRVVFGARDDLGGAGCVLDHLPPYYEAGGVYEWVGPIMQKACEPLYKRADAAFAELPVGRKQWEEAKKTAAPEPTVDDYLATLEQWRAEPRSVKITRARKAAAQFAKLAEDERLHELLPYAVALFERTGYLKDFKKLERYARRAGEPLIFEEVEETVREQLPDIWIRRALERDERRAAIECWFEHEEHRRARLVADELVAACPDEQSELLISCRMSTISYLIGRRKRRHYRRACAVLRKLRDELEEAGASEYWPFVLEDIRTQHGGLPALLDELAKAGFEGEG